MTGLTVVHPDWPLKVWLDEQGRAEEGNKRREIKKEEAEAARGEGKQIKGNRGEEATEGK